MGAATGRGPHVVLGILLGALAGWFSDNLGLWAVAAGIGTIGGIGLTSALGGATAAAGWLRAVAIADLGLAAVWLVVAFTSLIRAPAEAWVRADSLPTTAADAVIVLSSGVQSDSLIDHVGVDRLLSGLEVFQRAIAPKLITTRVSRGEDGHATTSDQDQRRIVALARMESAWSVLDTVHSTRDEAVRAAAVLLPRSHTIVVVTSPSHTRRACATFEAVGFRVYCVPSRERSADTWHPRTPEDRLAAFRAYLYEHLGMWKYAYKGWVPTR